MHVHIPFILLVGFSVSVQSEFYQQNESLETNGQYPATLAAEYDNRRPFQEANIKTVQVEKKRTKEDATQIFDGPPDVADERKIKNGLKPPKKESQQHHIKKKHEKDRLAKWEPLNEQMKKAETEVEDTYGSNVHDDILSRKRRGTKKRQRPVKTKRNQTKPNKRSGKGRKRRSIANGALDNDTNQRRNPYAPYKSGRNYEARRKKYRMHDNTGMWNRRSSSGTAASDGAPGGGDAASSSAAGGGSASGGSAAGGPGGGSAATGAASAPAGPAAGPVPVAPAAAPVAAGPAPAARPPPPGPIQQPRPMPLRYVQKPPYGGMVPGPHPAPYGPHRSGGSAAAAAAADGGDAAAAAAAGGNSAAAAAAASQPKPPMPYGRPPGGMAPMNGLVSPQFGPGSSIALPGVSVSSAGGASSVAVTAVDIPRPMRYMPIMRSGNEIRRRTRTRGKRDTASTAAAAATKAPPAASSRFMYYQQPYYGYQQPAYYGYQPAYPGYGGGSAAAAAAASGGGAAAAAAAAARRSGLNPMKRNKYRSAMKYRNTVSDSAASNRRQFYYAPQPYGYSPYGMPGGGSAAAAAAAGGGAAAAAAAAARRYG